MKKRILKSMIVFVCMLAFALSFQSKAQAGERNVPHFVQEYYDEHELKMANFVWFPFVASTQGTQALPWNWETFLFLSNFEDFTITVQAWTMGWGQAPSMRIITLGPSQKQMFTLPDWGYFNTVADVWFGSNNRIGAAAIVFDKFTGNLLTALPPIER